jgi:glycosyltransferase involved in cell wall biosynthesis
MVSSRLLSRLANAVRSPRTTAKKLIRRLRRRLGQNGTPANYERSFQKHLIQRRKNFTPPPGTIKFSILSSIYFNTSLVLFQEMIESVRSQIYKNWELILIVDGSVSEEISGYLSSLAGDSRIRIFPLSERQNIMGALLNGRLQASGDYIVPIDSDDLITPDAIWILASVIGTHGHPEYLYSDEDHIIEGHLSAPYQRPNWDPVLNICSSFIWHLTCIRRDIAESVSLYGDRGSNWCHDWDTVTRIYLAKLRPVHIPEILYHWRQHAKSSTGKSNPEGGSLVSQKNVLNGVLSKKGLINKFAIEPCPGVRGQYEWSLRRVPDEKVSVVCIWDKRPPEIEKLNIEMISWKDIRSRSPSLPSDFVLFVRGPLRIPEDSIWKAIGLFELEESLGVVSGRIVDARDIVIDGGKFIGDGGVVYGPYEGKELGHASPFAIADKDHCVSLPSSNFYVVKRAILDGIDLSMTPEELAIEIATVCSNKGLRIAQSPLVIAKRVTSEPVTSYRRIGEFPPDSIWLNIFREFEKRSPVGPG